MRDVSNSEDILDSRDIIARIEELGDAIADCEECGGADDADCNLCEDERTELKALKALEDEASSSPDWPHGETLIRDSYFEDYARQLAEDIGAISSDAGWPARCIDWQEAADELKQDYTSVVFDGVTYWIRS